IRTAMTSARLPGSSVPTRWSTPSTRAASDVAARRMSMAGSAAGSPAATLLRSPATFISSKRSIPLLQHAPSVPSPTTAPAPGQPRCGRHPPLELRVTRWTVGDRRPAAPDELGLLIRQIRRVGGDDVGREEPESIEVRGASGRAPCPHRADLLLGLGKMDE